MSAERQALERQRNQYNELKRQFDKWPAAQSEELQEQLSRVSVATAPGRAVPSGTGQCRLHRTSRDAAPPTPHPSSCSCLSTSASCLPPRSCHFSSRFHPLPLCLHSSPKVLTHAAAKKPRVPAILFKTRRGATGQEHSVGVNTGSAGGSEEAALTNRPCQWRFLVLLWTH